MGDSGTDDTKFRARGTVAIDVRTDKTMSLNVRISPAKSHSITVGKEEFIVFVEEPVREASTPPEPIRASIWRKSTRFTADKFHEILIAAAAQSVCIGIEIDSKNRIVGLSFPSIDS